MDSSETMANLGTPLGADLGAIERRLSEFWQSAAKSGGDTAAIRACSCNLVVIVSDAREAESLPPVLADVAEWHPCRSLVAFQDADAGAGLPPMQGWMRVQCRPQMIAGPEVCSEVITIGARHDAVAGLADTLISLLIPDLPVYLYWRSPKAAVWHTVEILGRAANLLIVDSRRSLETSTDRERLLAVLTDGLPSVQVRDLSWSRLTAWRDLIAQFFDTPASRGLLGNITDVEIRRFPAPGPYIPVLAFLFAGWLISRLSWRILSMDKQGEEWRVRVQKPGGEALIRFVQAAETPGRTGIQAVTLSIDGEKSFSVVRDNERECMTATVTGRGVKPMVHIVPCPSTREADLLISELSLPGEDAGFQAALSTALELEARYR